MRKRKTRTVTLHLGRRGTEQLHSLMTDYSHRKGEYVTRSCYVRALIDQANKAMIRRLEIEKGGKS